VVPKVPTVVAEGFRLISFQTAIFTPGLQFRATNISARLMSAWAKEFDGEPVLLPAMEGAPPGVPRLVMKSKDSAYRLQAGPTRLDLFWEAKSARDELEIGSHLRFCTEVFLQYLEVTKPKFQGATKAIRLI
jgi:hypothetical protein